MGRQIIGDGLFFLIVIQFCNVGIWGKIYIYKQKKNLLIMENIRMVAKNVVSWLLIPTENQPKLRDHSTEGVQPFSIHPAAITTNHPLSISIALSNNDAAMAHLTTSSQNSYWWLQTAQYTLDTGQSLDTTCHTCSGTPIAPKIVLLIVLFPTHRKRLYEKNYFPDFSSGPRKISTEKISQKNTI